MSLPCVCRAAAMYADQHQLHVSFNKFCILDVAPTIEPCTMHAQTLSANPTSASSPRSPLRYQPWKPPGTCSRTHPRRTTFQTQRNHSSRTLAEGPGHPAVGTKNHHKPYTAAACVSPEIKRARRNAVVTLLAKRRQGRACHYRRSLGPRYLPSASEA